MFPAASPRAECNGNGAVLIDVPYIATELIYVGRRNYVLVPVLVWITSGWGTLPSKYTKDSIILVADAIYSSFTSTNNLVCPHASNNTVCVSTSTLSSSKSLASRHPLWLERQTKDAFSLKQKQGVSDSSRHGPREQKVFAW